MKIACYLLFSAVLNKLFEFEDQGKLNLFILSSEKHVTIFCSFWRVVLNEQYDI